MKKFLCGTILVIVVALLFIFHETIFDKLNRIESVRSIMSHVMGVEPADASVKDFGSNYYAYGTLTNSEKLVYNQMADCLMNYREEVTISTTVEEEADLAFQCLISDHPEIFWTSAYELVTYHLSGIDSQYVFKPVYTMSVEEIKQYQKQIEEAVWQCLDKIPQNADTYEAVKYLYEYIILNTDYNKKAENNQNICSVFLEHESVCMGYSKAFQYLLQKCGIEAVTVSGESEEEAHAWNLVKLDENYYYVDVTWGDPEFSAVEEIGTDYLDYSFFCMTTRDLLKTHKIDNIFPLPDCVAVNYNFYYKEGLYLAEFQKKVVDEMIKRYFAEHSFVSIRCQDASVYRKLYDYLLEDANIGKFISGNKVSYVENKTYHTLSVFR